MGDQCGKGLGPWAKAFSAETQLMLSPALEVERNEGHGTDKGILGAYSGALQSRSDELASLIFRRLSYSANRLRQISQMRSRLRSGAPIPIQGNSGLGTLSSSWFQGSPSGMRNTPARGSRSLPNHPNVPIANRQSAVAYRSARPTGFCRISC